MAIRETSNLKGRVFYQFIDSTHDAFYQRHCQICNAMFHLGTVVVEIFVADRGRALFCGSCIDTMHDEKPTDGTALAVEEIRAKSALTDWIADTERPMESL